jgi:hypothetical protein
VGDSKVNSVMAGGRPSGGIQKERCETLEAVDVYDTIDRCRAQVDVQIGQDLRARLGKKSNQHTLFDSGTD